MFDSLRSAFHQENNATLKKKVEIQVDFLSYITMTQVITYNYICDLSSDVDPV